MSEISKTWFDQAMKLDVGQALFVRVANKIEQTKLANEFEEERELWSRIEPIVASQIFVNKVLRERKQYVSLERKYRAPFTAFLQDEEGKFTTVSVDPSRKRMIRLMLKDGMSKDEIEATLNGLTENEIVEFNL